MEMRSQEILPLFPLLLLSPSLTLALPPPQVYKSEMWTEVALLVNTAKVSGSPWDALKAYPQEAELSMSLAWKVERKPRVEIFADPELLADCLI